MKTIKLTKSEIDNACEVFGCKKKYTIIRRPQKDGKYWIAAVSLDGKMLREEWAENKEGVGKAIHDVNRWMDKLAMGGKMSSVSRHR